MHWVHRCRYVAVATGRFTTILQWQRKKDCYFEPLFVLARGLSLIALALSLVALTLVALTLVALTLAKSVALIARVAAISVIPLIYASSSLLSSRSLLSRSLLSCSLLSCSLLSCSLLSRSLSSRCLLSRCLLGRCLLGRCLLGRKLLRGNVIGGRDGTCGLPSLCRHGLSWQTSRLSQKIIQTGQESLLIAGIFLNGCLVGKRSQPARLPQHRSGEKRREVDRCGGRDFSGPCRDIDHLPGLKPPAFLWIRREIDENLPAETDYLDAFADIRNQEVRSRHRRRDGARFDCAAAASMVRMEKHDASVKDDAALACVKAENRIGA